MHADRIPELHYSLGAPVVRGPRNRRGTSRYSGSGESEQERGHAVGELKIICAPIASWARSLERLNRTQPIGQISRMIRSGRRWKIRSECYTPRIRAREHIRE